MVARRMYDGGRMSLTGGRIQTELTSESFFFYSCLLKSRLKSCILVTQKVKVDLMIRSKPCISVYECLYFYE